MDTVKAKAAAVAHDLVPSGAHRLKGKVAIVTGSSSGIGRAISLAYAREGAKLVLSDLRPESRNPAEADINTLDLVKKEGAQASFITCNTTDANSVDALVAGAVAEYGKLDIMVNCAGIVYKADQPKPIWEQTNESWKQTMEVNADGVFYGVRAASRQMVKQEPHENGDRGWIINLASVFGLVATQNAGAYVASKHLVVGLTKTAALDCAPYRIHVNAICPGWVQSAFTREVLADENVNAFATSLHPFRGLGVPADVAGVALFLASEDARWVTGSTIVTDGGYTSQ